MRLGLDTSFLDRPPSGIGAYTAALRKCIRLSPLISNWWKSVLPEFPGPSTGSARLPVYMGSAHGRLACAAFAR